MLGVPQKAEAPLASPGALNLKNTELAYKECQVVLFTKPLLMFLP